MITTKLEPLRKLEIIGKRAKEIPFSISRQRGAYFYIKTEDFDILNKINELAKKIPKISDKALKSIKIVGRGGYQGYRPFVVKGYMGTYLCILAEHFNKLKALNNAYKELLDAEKEKGVRLEKSVRKKKVEATLAELKGIVKEAEESSARKYLPEVMEEVEKLVSKLAKAVKLAHYDVALKLFPQAFELANYAKEASRKKKLPEIAERKYLYGIIPAPKKEISFGNIGIGNSGRVYTLNYKDLAAVVSDTPQQEYSVTEEYSKAHERVITEILKKHSVVPAAFGQVFKNQKILRVLMKKAYKALKECSKLVDNKVELGVKAVISKEALDERKEEMFKRGEEIFKGLSESAVEVVKGRLFSNRLILNASFLVNKDKIKNFSKEVGMISEKYKDLKLKYSGPWAPYSFACIKISAKGIEIGRGR